MLDDRLRQDYIPDMDVLTTINEISTAKLYPVRATRQKLVDVEVMWQNVCGTEIEDNVTCELGGNKSSTNLQEYAMAYEKIYKFSEDEADFIDNEFDIEQAITLQFLKADMLLAEDFAQYSVGRLEAFKGVNVVTVGKGVVVGADTFIAASYWNASLMAYFLRVSKLNKFTQAQLLSGNNLFEDYMNKNFEAGNANGSGDWKKYTSMKIAFDLVNVDLVNDPDIKTYLLSRGSLAMANRYWNPVSPERLDPFTRYAIPSRFLKDSNGQAMWFDVFYNTECTTNDLIQHNFKIKFRADIWLNPTGCEEQNTGVLAFICGVNS